MNLERRDFLKILSTGAATTAGLSTLQARTVKTLPPHAKGILYDATICIGCRSCEVACKRINNMPVDINSPLEMNKEVSSIWDTGDLSETTLNKIQAYRNGTGESKDQIVDGYGFIKLACMHCIDPDCVSACPVTALQKQPDTGIVTYNEDACIGCRYCQVACPYNIPKFEFDEAFPEIKKCQMCSHIQAEGGIPGCCEFCPTGASIFGSVSDLMKEAKHRLTLAEGSSYYYPNETISGKTTYKKVKKYVNYIYGENESGGAQYLILSAIPFEKLGLPKLPKSSGAVKSETIQHTAYKGLVAPIVLLGGLIFAAHRSVKDHHEEGGQQ